MYQNAGAAPNSVKSVSSFFGTRYTSNRIFLAEKYFIPMDRSGSELSFGGCYISVASKLLALDQFCCGQIFSTNLYSGGQIQPSIYLKLPIKKKTCLDIYRINIA